jgi:hypothetical protein
MFQAPSSEFTVDRAATDCQEPLGMTESPEPQVRGCGLVRVLPDRARAVLPGVSCRGPTLRCAVTRRPPTNPSPNGHVACRTSRSDLPGNGSDAPGRAAQFPEGEPGLDDGSIPGGWADAARRLRPRARMCLSPRSSSLRSPRPESGAPRQRIPPANGRLTRSPAYRAYGSDRVEASGSGGKAVEE